MNTQKPEPCVRDDGQTLDFHSIFLTLQGEGPYSGRRAVFIRLAGCNLQCPGCDTEYTKDRVFVPIESIVNGVINLMPTRGLVVITGGEPLRQTIGPLVDRLIDCDYWVQIESNGIFAPDKVLEEWLDTACVKLIISPKTNRINEATANYANYFKYVLDADHVDPVDGLPSKSLNHTATVRVFRPNDLGIRNVYLIPRDEGDEERNARNRAAVVASCLKYGYTAGVQLHKILNLR